MRPALLRPLLHASSSLTLLLAFWSWDALRLVLTAVALVGIGLETLRLRQPAFREWVAARVPVFRPAEATRVSGALWLGIGCALAAWLPVPAPGAAVLTAAIADPAGALVGGWLGRGRPKSWPGTAAVAGTAALVLSLLQLPAPAVLAAAAAAAAAERWSAPVDDNLAIPVSVGAVVWAMV